MKRLRYATIICLILSAVLLGISLVVRMCRKDNTMPTIAISGDTPVLSMADLNSDAVLAGITAWDDKDGDLTDRVLLQNIMLQDGKKMTATYAVVDSSNHVATASRIIECSDYVPPKFHLETALRYTAGSAIRIRDHLTATDLLDGDISERIKMNTSSLTARYEGVYPTTFEVSNSLGDTSRITLDVTIHSPVPGEPVIYLSEYLIYLQPNEEFDPLDYLSYVSGADDDNIHVELPDGGFQKGMNRVIYSCRGTSGLPGSTTLYVVVE